MIYKEIYRAIKSGLAKIIINKDELNKINIFPVPDGDTGSNLTSMAFSILSNQDGSLGESALDGARGNSGMIFGQFLYTLDSNMYPSIDLKEFTQVVKKSFESAYQAVPDPKEGTILSMMRVFAEFFEKNHMYFSLEKIIDQVMTPLQDELQATKNKLECLKKADVVDSGAKGFMLFVEGMKEYLLGINPKNTIQNTRGSSTITSNYIHEMTKRYCVEIVLLGENLDKKSIMTLLNKDTDSTVIAGDENKLQLHFHTDTPYIILEELSKIGSVLSKKIDDMVKQNECIYHRKNNIAFVVDSGVSLSREIIDKHQIFVAPLNIHIDNHSYIDEIGITLSRCFHLHENVSIKTSQPSSKTFANIFSFLENHYDSIIVLTVSKEGSGTYNSALQGSKLANISKPIDIIDSEHVASSAGIIAYQIAIDISNKLPHELIVKHALENIKNTQEIMGLSSLDPIIKGGRLKPTIGKALTLLKVLPVIGARKGMPYISSVGIGINSVMKASINELKKKIKLGKKIKHYTISHSFIDLKELENFYEKIKSTIGFEAISIAPINPSLFTHIGKGGYSIGVLYDK